MHLFLLLASLHPLAAAEASALTEGAMQQDSEQQEEVILRILDLREQIQELLAALPPDVRDEVERRWAESQLPMPSVPAEPVPPIEDGMPEPGDVEISVPPVPVDETPDIPLPEEEPMADPGDQLPEPVADAGPACGGFRWFDTIGDELVSGADRQWRFLRLWFDNGDGVTQEEELGSLFDLGVRMIDVDLRFYLDDEGNSEDVDAGERIELSLIGKGSAARPVGVLVIESDRLARGQVFTLTDLEGNALSGYQPLGAGTRLEDSAGQQTPIVCPATE